MALNLSGAGALAQEAPPEKPGGMPPALVEVSEVLESEMISRITLVGTAEAWLETVVAAQEEGLVERVLVDEGDRVKEGQLLCQQESGQIALKIQAARAALSEAQVLERQTEREWERQKRLFQIKSVAEKAYEDAKFARDGAKAKVLRLEAEILVLEDNLAKKRIMAPVSGYVSKRHALVGQWLGKGDSVVTLVTLNPMRVNVPVPERYIHRVKIGGKAQVSFDALPSMGFTGTVTAVIPRADEAARTFPVRIVLANPEGTIKAGMLGRVTVPIGNPRKVFLVPKDALTLSQDGTSVYVVNDQSAHLVPVQVGSPDGALIEVQGDLKAGMKVVIRGNERLIPGQPLQILREKNPPQTERPEAKNPKP